MIIIIVLWVLPEENKFKLIITDIKYICIQIIFQVKSFKFLLKFIAFTLKFSFNNFVCHLVNIVNNNGFVIPFIKTQIRSITAGPGGIGEVGGRNMALGWANYPSSPNLIYLDFGNSSITRVASYGFNTIRSLKLCIFPTTLTKFGNAVFTSCESLEAIIIKATTPPIYDGETYQGTQYTLWNPSNKPNVNVKLYVPKDSLTAYQNDTVWGQYADIMLTIEDDFVKPDYFEDYYNDYS